MASLEKRESIAAIATPSGSGGIGIVRISGDDIGQIVQGVLGQVPKPRAAVFLPFLDCQGTVIDQGIALYFPSPNSFTGEDVLELQGHGGVVILNILLRRVLELGARPANPGEFTERAFLNNKIDLAQAEAVSDLIQASTEQAARSARHSLDGVFSTQIQELVEELIEVRLYVESAIDFVEEEIDFLNDGVVYKRIIDLSSRIDLVLETAKQGRLLRNGMTVVIAGRPNAGKSSLLNYLAGKQSAIVTAVEGTTRDVLRESIQIDGMPLHIIDTAGLRETTNAIELEGVRRAKKEINNADRVLWIIDVRDGEDQSMPQFLNEHEGLTRVFNKIDLSGDEPRLLETKIGTDIYLSVKVGDGMEFLREHLKKTMGFNNCDENVFSARSRHIEALTSALSNVKNAADQLSTYSAGELVAEELKLAQQSISEITGEFSSDDLLGRIFSSFCIGK